MQESWFRIYFVWPDAARHEYGPRERKCKLPAHRDTVTLDKPEEEKQGHSLRPLGGKAWKAFKNREI